MIQIEAYHAFIYLFKVACAQLSACARAAVLASVSLCGHQRFASGVFLYLSPPSGLLCCLRHGLLSELCVSGYLAYEQLGNLYFPSH